MTIALSELVELMHAVSIDLFGLHELLVKQVLVLCDCYQSLLHFQDQPLVVFVDLVELEGFLSEPVSFFLHVDEACLLFGFDSLNGSFFFQVSHVLLHYVHFLFECSQEVLFVLLDDLLDEVACVLYEITKRKGED